MDQEPPPSQPKPKKYPTPLAYIRCPKCGFDSAFVIAAHFNHRGFFCPECQHTWDTIIRHTWDTIIRR